MQVEIAQVDRGRVVKKNVALVHSDGAALSLLERKTYNVLLLQSYSDLRRKATHEIPFKTLTSLLKITTRDYDLVRSVLTKLSTTAVEANLLEDGDTPDKRKRFKVSALLSFGEIGDGVVRWRYDESMVELLHEPSIYAFININAQSEFTSGYSLNLYETCARFRGIPFTGYMPVDEFRRLTGATARMYDSTEKLKKRVIEPAVREINQHSELALTPKYDHSSGRGRPLRAVGFEIRRNPQYLLFETSRTESDRHRANPLYAKFRDFGCNEQLILSILKSGDEAAARLYAYVDDRHKKGKVRSTGAYISHLVTTNAQVGPSAAELRLAKQKSEQQERERAEQLSADRKDALDHKRRAFERNRNASVLASIAESQRAILQAEYLSDESQRAKVGRYIKDGKITGLGNSLFENWIVQRMIGAPTDDEFEQWLAMEGSNSGARAD